MIREEVAKLTKRLFLLFRNGKDSADLTIKNICIPLDLLKDGSVHLSQEVNSWTEKPSRLATDRMLDILTDYGGPAVSGFNYISLSATNHTTLFRPPLFLNTHFRAIQLFPIGVEDVPPISPSVFYSTVLFRDVKAPPSSWLVFLYRPAVYLRKKHYPIS